MIVRPVEKSMYSKELAAKLGLSRHSLKQFVNSLPNEEKEKLGKVGYYYTPKQIEIILENYY